MAKKIKNMTEKYPDFPEIVWRKMMVRYENQDWDYDVVFYLDESYKCVLYGNYAEKTRVNTKNILDYWKYVFLMAKEEKEEAMYYLRESYIQKGPDAMAQYAYFYYTGQEVTNVVNRKKAKRLFEMALTSKSMFAEYLFAEALTYKKQNNEEALLEAIPYYETALKKGVVWARPKLAECYIKTNQKIAEAIKLLEKCDDKQSKEILQELRFEKNYGKIGKK